LQVDSAWATGVADGYAKLLRGATVWFLPHTGVLVNCLGSNAQQLRPVSYGPGGGAVDVGSRRRTWFSSWALRRRIVAMREVICGGGVIGACTAYFLSLRQVEVIVVERTGVACAASGKSGGFLALDWCDGSPLGRLARRSFALHAELAATLDGSRWGYRRLDTWSVLASERRRPGGGGAASSPSWLGERALVQGKLGTKATTAQVHPARFTEAMLQAAIYGGAQLRLGRVTSVVLNATGSRALGVEVDGELLSADAVLIAMGPWSMLACRSLPLPAVYGLKGNSVVFESGSAISADALFVELTTAHGEVQTPEVFPRADGTTYVCGLSSQQPLPDDPADVSPDPGAREALRAMTHAFAPGLADAITLATQACFRPVTQDGLPLLGPVPGVANAYVATGHSVWGILNAPASGEAMAELIAEGGTSHVDLRPFNSARLPAR
jgi:glycine/D-amino acid oxidase-like deaminating enzyme